MEYRPEIDGLRAIAVLAVVAYHAGLIPAGFVGVDVFFVISGYLITALLLREARIDVVAFYARRVRRILPVMVVVVVAVLMASVVLLAPIGQQPAVFKSAAASLGMVANIFFQATTGGYFDTASDQLPLLHLWSLSVEEQFYLLWPAVLILTPRARLRAMIVTLAIASFALAEWLRPEVAFYQMPARFWELAAGGLIATSRVRAGMLTGYAGLALIGWAVLVPAMTFPGIGALPAVLGASLLLAAVHARADLGMAGTFLRSRPMVFFGLISYSLYLWHWPLLALDKATRLDPQPLSVALALCALSVPPAWLSYRYVETPFRRLRAPPLRTVGAGVLVLLATASVALARNAPEDTTTRQAAATLRDHAPMDCHYGKADSVLPRCPVRKPRVAVWGDSYGLAWTPYAETFGPTLRLTRDDCGPMGGRSALCDEFSRYAKAAILAADPEVVVVAGRWQGLGVDGLADALDGLPGRVVVIGPTPQMRRPAPECIQRQLTDKCGISRAAFEAEAGAIRERVRQAAEQAGAEFVDPTDYLCTATECPMMKAGRSMYWDDDHLARSAVIGFARSRPTLP